MLPTIIKKNYVQENVAISILLHEIKPMPPSSAKNEAQAKVTGDKAIDQANHSLTLISI